ncbi:hypothetical protein ZWY2020_043419 [Hordeum vulgare]|nr:hypothetical protein ZWY2020_043419 [Hordeum vulgare]
MHPQDHTTLDDILPCVDVATANESMHGARSAFLARSTSKTGVGEWKKFDAERRPAGKELCTMGWVTPRLQPDDGSEHRRGCTSTGLSSCSSDCTFVRDHLSISVNNCASGTTGIVYDGLVVMSASVMLSIVCWMVHSKQRCRRASSG